MHEPTTTLQFNTSPFSNILHHTRTCFPTLELQFQNNCTCRLATTTPRRHLQLRLELANNSSGDRRIVCFEPDAVSLAIQLHNAPSTSHSSNTTVTAITHYASRTFFTTTYLYSHATSNTLNTSAFYHFYSNTYPSAITRTGSIQPSLHLDACTPCSNPNPPNPICTITAIGDISTTATDSTSPNILGPTTTSSTTPRFYYTTADTSTTYNPTGIFSHHTIRSPMPCTTTSLATSILSLPSHYTPPPQPLPLPPPPPATGDSSPQQPPPLQPTLPEDSTTPTAIAAHSQPSTSPSIVSATPTTAPPDPNAGTSTAPASPAPSPNQHHSNRHRHHKRHRKSDHHRHGRRHRHRRHTHRHHSRGRRHHSSTRRHRAPSTSTYSASSSPSRSRSRNPIELRPNTDSTAADNNDNTTSQYPLTPVVRRPPNVWRPPPHIHQLSPQEQILTWLEFHADQLEYPNRPQHQYLAHLLSDSNITYKDISDFRQYTHVKWNDTTQQYEQFQYNAISLPYLSNKASTPTPPPVSRATSTDREVAHINAGHTGPVGNITNISTARAISRQHTPLS